MAVSKVSTAKTLQVKVQELFLFITKYDEIIFTKYIPTNDTEPPMYFCHSVKQKRLRFVKIIKKCRTEFWNLFPKVLLISVAQFPIICIHLYYI